MNDGTQTIDEIEKQMRRAGAFHPDDLAFNQFGELSQRQKRWLMVEIIGWSVQIAIYVVVIIFAWGFYYLQAPYNTAIPAWWCGSLFWSFLLLCAIALCVENIRPIWADMTENEVRSITGPISKDELFYRGRNSRNWSLQIRDQQFSIQQFAYASLINGQSYRVFYTPSLKRVINIEPFFDPNAETQSD